MMRMIETIKLKIMTLKQMKRIGIYGINHEITLKINKAQKILMTFMLLKKSLVKVSKFKTNKLKELEI